METWTTFVTTADYAKTVARFEAINARAAKKNMEGQLSISIVGEPHIGNVMRDGELMSMWGYDIEVAGRVAIDGWQPIAKAEALPDATDMVVTGFDRTSDIDYRDEFVKGFCGHCGSTRSNRRHLYLLENTDTGETKQVGRSCLKDFLGHNATAADLDHMLSDNIRHPHPLFDVVATACGTITVTGGYVRAGHANATATIVRNHLDGRSVYGNRTADDREASAEFSAKFAAIADEAAQQAADAIAWVLGTDEGGYIGNIRAIAQSGVVADKHYGLAVSLAQAYLRHLETADERRMREQAHATREAERAARKAASQHVGTVGEKITVTGEIAVMWSVTSDYGTSWLIIMHTTDGNTVKMFTGAAWSDEVERGDAVTITGTVREHDEYNGEKNTLISRPKRCQ